MIESGKVDLQWNFPPEIYLGQWDGVVSFPRYLISIIDLSSGYQ
jgi:hypothetical protein